MRNCFALDAADGDALIFTQEDLREVGKRQLSALFFENRRSERGLAHQLEEVVAPVETCAVHRLGRTNLGFGGAGEMGARVQPRFACQ
jgi:hypothetical protein